MSLLQNAWRQTFFCPALNMFAHARLSPRGKCVCTLIWMHLYIHTHARSHKPWPCLYNWFPGTSMLSTYMLITTAHSRIWTRNPSGLLLCRVLMRSDWSTVGCGFKSYSGCLVLAMKNGCGCRGGGALCSFMTLRAFRPCLSNPPYIISIWDYAWYYCCML